MKQENSKTLYEVAIVTGEVVTKLDVLAETPEKAKMTAIAAKSSSITGESRVFIRPFCR